MICIGCGNRRAYTLKINSTGSHCDRCGTFRARGSPDVYFRQPYLDPNLPHPNRPHEKDGVWVRSKQHKQALLNEQKLVERGDKRHGARL